MKTVLVIALFATFQAVAEEKSPPVVAPAVASVGAEGVVCEKKKELGSKLAKRVCTTEVERRAAKEKAAADLQDLGNCSGNETPCTGGL